MPTAPVLNCAPLREPLAQQHLLPKLCCVCAVALRVCTHAPLCRPVAGGGGGFKAPLTRMVCTPCYRAPEVVMSRGGYTGACWLVPVLLLLMVVVRVVWCV